MCEFPEEAKSMQVADTPGLELETVISHPVGTINQNLKQLKQSKCS